MNSVGVAGMLSVLLFIHHGVAAFSSPRVAIEGTAATAPAAWEGVGAASPDAPHVLSFFLKQRNTIELKSALDRVSSPSSAEYGQHWSLADVTKLVQPPAEAVAAVVSWLKTEGLDGSLSPTGEIVHVGCTAVPAGGPGGTGGGAPNLAAVSGCMW